MGDEIKRLFQELPDNDFSSVRLEKALERVKGNDDFRRKNYAKYTVILCGDHNGNEINSEFLSELKRKLRAGHGITCYIGKDFIDKAKGSRQLEIQKAYLGDADIIIFIDGKSPGTLNESNDIREHKSLNSKTIAFFRYSTFKELIEKPDRQDYISEFKYPIPYREKEELDAKIIFGVKHMILYLLNKELNTQKKDNERI
ncbi:Uncharacterised protein [uncultured archaeon]|nr:Uncharacterised protein [uncultured archaeon]